MIESIIILEKKDHILNAQYHDILIENMNDLMKDEILNQAMKDAVELTQKDEEIVLDILITTDVDKIFFLENDFLEAESYPSTRVRDPE